VKRARLLSQNQIREIVMDSDSDEEKYYASEDTENEEELRPPSRWSSIFSLQSQIFPPAALKMRIMLVRAVQHGSTQKKALFPPVGPGHCQQLYPFIFMLWEENLTQRFSTHPYQRDGGTV